MAVYTEQIAAQARGSEVAQRLQSIAGVGPTTAAALLATVGEPEEFRNGRQFAAWLGLTPKQHSTGGKTRLGRITKRGDAYLRTLLILGAKSALQAALRKPPAARHRLQQWIVTVLDRIGYHKTLGGDCQQTRPHHLGVAGEGRRLRRAAFGAEGSGSGVTKQRVQPYDCAKGESDNWSDRRLQTQTNLTAAIKADERMWSKRAVFHDGPRQHQRR